MHLSSAQERGLIILVATGILASGLAIFFTTSRTGSIAPAGPIVLHDVRILIPTFVDAEPESKIDLNHASAAELESLPGIGPVLAGRIVDYREEHGSFRNVEGLSEVSGIGTSVVERIADLLTLGD